MSSGSIPGAPHDSAVSVVVPVFNSYRSLPELAERVAQALTPVTRAYELVFVDDGSRDTSWDVIMKLAREDRRVHGLVLSRNFGQHNALLAGIRAANYEIVVTMDDDLQHRPEEIPRLLAELTQDVDLVYGTPVEEEHGFWRSFCSRSVKAALATSLGASNARSISAFRAFRTSLRDGFMTDDAFPSIDVLLSWTTTRTTQIGVEMDDRKYGRSHYNFRRLVRHSLNMVTGYSTGPLRLVTLVGFAFAFFGLGLFLFVIVRWFIFGSTVAGFTFLAAIISSFSGAQMLAIGILGEYVGRIHFRSMRRPMFLVRTTTDEQELNNPTDETA